MEPQAVFPRRARLAAPARSLWSAARRPASNLDSAAILRSARGRPATQARRAPHVATPCSDSAPAAMTRAARVPAVRGLEVGPSSSAGRARRALLLVLVLAL
eukprot:7124002-Pyramimonas_sp.AAC.1